VDATVVPGGRTPLYNEQLELNPMSSTAMSPKSLFGDTASMITLIRMQCGQV